MLANTDREGASTVGPGLPRVRHKKQLNSGGAEEHSGYSDPKRQR